MQEVIVKFKNSKTLSILTELAKYFDFTISIPKKGKTEIQVHNGVVITRKGRFDENYDNSPIFSGRNIEAGKLRKELWQRKK